jgi:hypothetical protein
LAASDYWLDHIAAEGTIADTVATIADIVDYMAVDNPVQMHIVRIEQARHSPMEHHSHHKNERQHRSAAHIARTVYLPEAGREYAYHVHTAYKKCSLQIYWHYTPGKNAALAEEVELESKPAERFHNAYKMMLQASLLHDIADTSNYCQQMNYPSVQAYHNRGKISYQ